MSDDLASRLRAELGRRFPELAMTLGTGSEVAHIPCPSGSIGDVRITYDGEVYDEFTVYFEGMTHCHFADYDGDTDIIVECCDYLDDLFHDRIVVWAKLDGSRGGSSSVEGSMGRSFVEVRLDSDQMQPRSGAGVRRGTWSAPISPHPPDADDLNRPPSR